MKHAGVPRLAPSPGRMSIDRMCLLACRLACLAMLTACTPAAPAMAPTTTPATAPETAPAAAPQTAPETETAPAPQTAPQTALGQAAQSPALPTVERWRRHLSDELLPFWTHADALGQPYGNFPTYRCNDGSAYRADAPCAELDKAPSWIRDQLGVEYTRMKSRQTFVYGVGYHITGDPRLLAHARAGVEYLRKHAYEAGTGSAISLWRRDKNANNAAPGPGARTAQDLAYAQLGLAFYYYLTRDPEVLRDLVRLDEHLFTTYFEPSWGMLRWVARDHGEHSAGQMELVAQLDPINAYLLLLTPLLDEPMAGAWRGHMATLLRALRERFFAAEHGMFWGAVHSPERMALGTHHTDFGHTIKALWMIYLAGQRTGDSDAIAFARTHMDSLIERAYNRDTGCWASTLRPGGTVDRSSNWWTSAELDQSVATLAMAEPGDMKYRTYLAGSFACWLERFVDREHGEVWTFLGEDGTLPSRTPRPAKVFQWKNGYHSAEHALVSMIATAVMSQQPIELYYAFRHIPSRDRIQPYFFRGTIEDEQAVNLPGMPELAGRRVTFARIRP